MAGCGRNSLLAAITAFLAAVSIAVGCGTEDLSPDTVARAADKTAEAGGARISLRMTMTGPDGKAVPLTGKGVMDATGNKGRIDMDLSSVAANAGERIPKEDAVISSIFAGYDIYLGGPVFEKELPGGKEWIKIDVREISRELGTDQLMDLNQNDPRKTLDYLRGTGDVEELGTATVRGAETTRYEARVDLRDYVNELPPGERADAKAGIERARELFGGTDKVRFEVWIDEKDLVRRIEDTYSMPIPGEGKVRIEERLEFFDFGTPVSLDIPPARDVKDLTELAKREVEKEAAGKK